MGPMFAGKTTELMRRVKREVHARRSCFVIKYAKDVRYDHDSVASHDQLTLKAQAAVAALGDVGERWRTFDVVAVDEGQFFPDLVPFCNKVADAGKIVMISALDGDYLRKPFGQICEIVPYCESVEKLTAVCMMCHSRQASFTRRTVASAEQELIGGADMYIATCRQCFNEPTSPSLSAMREVRDAIKEVELACLGRTTAAVAANKKNSDETGAATPTATPVRSAVRKLANRACDNDNDDSNSAGEGRATPDTPDSPAVRLTSLKRATSEVAALSKKPRAEAIS